MTTDELGLLRSTVRGVLSGGSGSLRALGDLGLLGLLVPEEHGGAGWSPVEAAVVADEIGRHASVGAAERPGDAGRAPAWLPATVAAGALASSGADGPAADLLATTLDGTAPAVAVAGALRVVDGSASGSLVGVDAPDDAPAVVVLGAHGEAPVLLELDAPDVATRPDPASIDTTRPRRCVDVDEAPTIGLAAVPGLLDAARVLTAAISVGSLRAALERLTTYLTDRKAFGAPIASFQAIQHRIVDLSLIEIRGGVAVDAAARALADDPADASRVAAVAHGYVAQHVPDALDECIQLTGGIGFTWEYPLHHELRASVADASAFGSARDSCETLLAVTGWA